ncbi:MAG: hypothetical protein A2265_01200, partial [Bacteroidetes bacterium RIFOXYA12_FULL_33_9]
CGNYNSENDCYNREHSWPQSWFDESSPMVSDLFHVYPTDGYVNGKRANYPYGEVNSPNWTSMNGSKLGTCSYPGYTGIVFEPIDAYKGDFARTYFYMSTRYYGEDAGWTGSPMVNGAELEPWAMKMMLEWSDADPVSQKEIDRNNAVYGIQNNRNPFIDHPEYAMEIWRYDEVEFEVGTNKNITCGDSVLLNPTIVYYDENALIYNWQPSFGLSNSTIKNPVAKPIETTKYVLTVTCQGSCVVKDSLTIYVSTNLDLDFVSDNDSLFETPFIFQFANASADLTNYTFEWTIGDSTFVNNNSYFSYEFFENGTYTVSLLATNNQNGCFDSITKPNYLYTNDDSSSSIESKENSQKYNVYPNPTRDYLHIDISNLKEADYGIQIIDPQGKTVYEENSMKKAHSIDIRAFKNSGVYLISIHDKAKNQTEIRKFVFEIME